MQNVIIKQIVNFFVFLEAHSTFILVVITGIYAYITYKMTIIMSRQLEVDIKISNIKLGTCLMEKETIQRIKNKRTNGKNPIFCFNISCDILNKGAGNCSISKPSLILNFPDGKEFEIKPKSKDVEIKKVGDDATQEIVTDFGNTIYLKSRDFINVELDYRKTGTDIFLQYLNNHLENVKYFLEYTDNLENKHRLSVENTYPTNEVKRY